MRNYNTKKYGIQNTVLSRFLAHAPVSDIAPSLEYRRTGSLL